MPNNSGYVRVIAAGLLLVGLGSASACGSDDGDDGGSSSTGSGGTGSGGTGSGGTATELPIECGSNTCQPLDLKIGGAPMVAACCAEGDACGLDSSYLEAFGPTFDVKCQARDQPGVLDSNCPDSMNTQIPDSSFTIGFKGCCRTDVGTCGYMLDKLLGTIELGLGCVDSEPFLDGGTASPCGTGGAPSGTGGAPSGTGGVGGG